MGKEAKKLKRIEGKIKAMEEKVSEVDKQGQKELRKAYREYNATQKLLDKYSVCVGK